jgi:phosphoribosylglycinamide formyltransferase-1
VSIAALASGTGTILEALLEDALPIDVVVVDRPCRAESVAAAAGVPSVLVLRKDFSPHFDRDTYTREVVAALEPYRPDLLVMAGFGTVLSKPIHDAYPGRILNTHPALLPKFKGWHAVEAALDAGVNVTGCTVHVATLEVDDCPILAQVEVPVLEGDDATTLAERIKHVERRLYPETIRAVLSQLSRGESLI